MSRTFNRDPKYMTGEYTKMFDIEPIPSNKQFATNPYTQAYKCFDTVCFSLTNGALRSDVDRTQMLVYTPEGKLIKVPAKHSGPVSSKNVKNDLL